MQAQDWIARSTSACTAGDPLRKAACGNRNAFPYRGEQASRRSWPGRAKSVWTLARRQSVAALRHYLIPYSHGTYFMYAQGGKSNKEEKRVVSANRVSKVLLSTLKVVGIVKFVRSMSNFGLAL